MHRLGIQSWCTFSDPVAGLRAMKIAVVEHDPAWRAPMAELVQALGHEVRTFEEFHTIQAPMMREFDIVVCDNKFSKAEKFGIEFLVELRKAGHLGKLVLYTNFPRAAHLRLAKRHAIAVHLKDEIIDTVIERVSAA